MEKYWLTLNPDTFLWIKQREGFIYNTVNYQNVNFVSTPLLDELFVELLDIDNLYRIELSDETLKQAEVGSLVDKIVKTASGSITLNDGINRRPVSMKPVLKIQDDIKYYQWERNQGIDGNVIHNLHQMVFYINGSDFGEDFYFKQTLFPLREKNRLDKDKIVKFSFNARKSPFLSVIALVGNIWEYPDYDLLLNELRSLERQIEIYVTEEDALLHSTEIGKLGEGEMLHILVKDGKAVEQLLQEAEIKKASFSFIVTTENEYARALVIIDRHALVQAEIRPVYTETNALFFEEYLYLVGSDIKEIGLSKREIFARMSLNINDFGKLFISSNGTVYGNMNDNPIGSIDESPHSIVYREMTEGKSWFRIRNQKPCCDCVYQWLCPSPSNYELVIGKPNLCRVIDN